jgi:hypothetical protein
MKFRVLLILAVAATSVIPASAGGKKKKEQPRGILERMEAVPCGAKQRGLTGLGSVWASVGVTRVNSDEKLCPQYLLRTDDMDYEIRPRDMKHPVVLPVGHEVLYKIKKDRMTIKVPYGDNKTLTYQVVSMKQAGTEKDAQNSEQPTEKP